MREISKLVRGAGVVWIAFAIVAVLEDNAQTIEFGHEDLDNASFEVRKATFATGLATDVEEDRATLFVVCVIEEIPLRESSIVVWCITRIIGEMVNLSTLEETQLTNKRLPAE